MPQYQQSIGDSMIYGVDHVTRRGNTHIVICWGAVKFGFGEIVFTKIKESILWQCDDEFIGKDRVKSILETCLSLKPHTRRNNRRWAKKPTVRVQQILSDILNDIDNVKFVEHN